MKREIKFRGQILHHDLIPDSKNCWVKGYYFQDETSSFIFQPPYNWEVVPETVGQFTGLLDKNGKEIFEGDIIRSYDSNGETITHYIEWKERDAVYRATNIKYPLLGGWAYQDWIDECEKEIIGNVFDNPELLKTETL